MKKTILIAGAFLLATTSLMAQKEYKLAKSAGKLVLNNMSNLTVEGYDGREIIFSVTQKEETSLFQPNEKKGKDPRAEGLSALNNNGFDNTGLGLSITEKGNETVVSPVSSSQDRKIKIRLPNTVALTVNNSGWPFTMSDSNAIILKNLKNEVDISVQFENCRLENVSGPLSIKTLSGNVEVVLNNNFKAPVSIYSVRGFIDLAVNERTQADLSMSTMGGGTIYADKSLKLEAKPAKNNDLEPVTVVGSVNTRFKTATIASRAPGSAEVDSTAPNRRTYTFRGVGVNSDSIRIHTDSIRVHPGSPVIYGYSMPFSGNSSFNGTLNGGGGKIKIQSTGGNIYLRK